jgi:hypothetical protein
VSGFVRTAELLTRDGLKAYDGAGCRAIPILSGILPDGTHLQPLRHDEDGSVCGKPQELTSSAFLVPKPVPAGAVVVAANAGSDYLFVPDGNRDVVTAAVASPKALEGLPPTPTRRAKTSSMRPRSRSSSRPPSEAGTGSATIY